jgi:hypothetical protein
MEIQKGEYIENRKKRYNLRGQGRGRRRGSGSGRAVVEVEHNDLGPNCEVAGLGIGSIEQYNTI